MSTEALPQELPAWENTLTRVPYWIFQRTDVYDLEQEKIFRGPNWNYLCLESELSTPGSYCSTFVGNTPVIVTRDRDGELYAFENRCAHRGALLALDKRGEAKDFTCVYHAWTYNLQGDLTGVAFKDGIRGEGGMPANFCLEAHGPRKLRIETIAGLVFGTFSEDTPDLEDYLGDEVADRIKRVLDDRNPVILGRFTQAIPNNWKLYMENVKDSYHASILHLFFTTFELNKLSQRGGIIVSEDGGCHVSYSEIDRTSSADTIYADQQIRSDSEYRLADETILEGFKEFDDDITLQILSVYPGFVLQQIQNSIAVRQVLPVNVERTNLNWTYLGFDSDTAAQRKIRMKQSNLVGPGGYVSMEDGCVGGFVQRGIAGAPDQSAVVEMGGSDTSSSDVRITEASIRAFWMKYRNQMGLDDWEKSEES